MLFTYATPDGAHHFTISVKPESMSLCVDRSEIVYYDLAGRLLGAFLEGINYKRGLDNRVMQVWRDTANGARRRRWLDPERRDALYADVATHVARARDAWRTDRATDGDAPPALFFERVCGGDAAALQADADRFRRIYRPVGILPPDQYLSLVLQATEGCSYNACTFCDFYRDRPFRIKSPAEFRRHIDAVRAYFGEGLKLRKALFLADANALMTAQPRLVALMDAANAAFDILPHDLPQPERAAWRQAHPDHVTGIHSFIDVFHADRKSVEDFRALRSRNLRRVYIGLETGSDALLEFLNKPGTAAMAVEVVETIKAAGLHVGLIVMTGIGGRRHSDAHVRDTTAALNRMPLDREDLLYFSEFVETPGLPYTARADAAGIERLSHEQAVDQMRQIRAALRFSDGARTPRIAPYDIREFIY